LDLRTDLAAKLRGRTCVIGIGGSEWGDDAFGLDMASSLEAAGYPHVIMAGAAPESVVGRVAAGDYDDILLLDAVDYAGEPGSVVFLESSQLRSRYPQVSTHKLSLGALASVLEYETGARVWLLGAKPFSLAPASSLTEQMKATSEALRDVLLEVLGRQLTTDD
jgi:hydrogenase maturation protease